MNKAIQIIDCYLTVLESLLKEEELLGISIVITKARIDTLERVRGTIFRASNEYHAEQLEKVIKSL